MHEPLYDLYCQLLQGIGTFSVDEFDAITREEALVPRLNALDQACEARGITGLGAGDGDNVTPLARPPDAVMRALRADVKRREAERTNAATGGRDMSSSAPRDGWIGTCTGARWPVATATAAPTRRRPRRAGGR